MATVAAIRAFFSSLELSAVLESAADSVDCDETASCCASFLALARAIAAATRSLLGSLAGGSVVVSIDLLAAAARLALARAIAAATGSFGLPSDDSGVFFALTRANAADTASPLSVVVFMAALRRSLASRFFSSRSFLSRSNR